MERSNRLVSVLVSGGERSPTTKDRPMAFRMQFPTLPSPHPRILATSYQQEKLGLDHCSLSEANPEDRIKSRSRRPLWVVVVLAINQKVLRESSLPFGRFDSHIGCPLSRLLSSQLLGVSKDLARSRPCEREHTREEERRVR